MYRTKTSIRYLLGIAAVSCSATEILAQGPVLPPGYNANGTLPPASNQPANAALQNAAAGWSKPIYSFIDPRTNIVYDRFIENESVPTTKWEVEEKMERRWVPEMTTETRQVTQVEYVPVMSYETKVNNGSIWNPFSDRQPTVQYVPKMDYVPVNRVVNMPVSVQKYVEREIPVRVPRLVQATESRAKYVDRPRAGQAATAPIANAPAAAPQYSMQPISTPSLGTHPPIGYQPGASLGIPSQTFPLQPNNSPYYANVASPVVAPPSIAPTSIYNTASNQPLLQFGRQANNSTISPYVPGTNAPLVPISGNNYLASNTTSQGTRFRWPSWLSGNGPLMRSSLFQENRTLPNGLTNSNPSLAAVSSPSVGFAGSLPYGYQQVLPQSSTLQPNVNFNSTLPSQSQVAGNLTVRPTTRTAFPTRTAEQIGMPATNLR